MNRLAIPNLDRETASARRSAAVDHTAEERFRCSSYRALRDVSCIASDGVVYLDGCLPSYYLKQIAQEIASGVEGVDHVVNRIEVFTSPGRGRTGRETVANEAY
jgi:osmotically-inducible protein OsmY